MPHGEAIIGLTVRARCRLLMLYDLIEAGRLVTNTTIQMVASEPLQFSEVRIERHRADLTWTHLAKERAVLRERSLATGTKEPRRPRKVMARGSDHPPACRPYMQLSISEPTIAGSLSPDRRLGDSRLSMHFRGLSDWVKVSTAPVRSASRR